MIRIFVKVESVSIHIQKSWQSITIVALMFFLLYSKPIDGRTVRRIENGKTASLIQEFDGISLSQAQ